MTENGWRKVAAVGEIEPGQARAVRLGEEGRSVALFNEGGRIYATDNQCPHMGYPLTRGVVRNGVVTCDWHGRRFDLEGGGCFNNMCDDLTVFPVEIRDGGEVWIQVEEEGYRRKEVHLELLREGLLHGDRWTISKALALLSRGGVPREEIVAVVLRHFGRRVASSGGDEAGTDLARLVGGLAIADRYEGADHLACLATAATAASGEAASRLRVVPLPEPVTQERIDDWVRVFSRNGQANRIERCLFTTRSRGDTDRILPLLFECAAQPGFLGFGGNLVTLAGLAEVVERFGWEASSELVLNLGSRTVGQGTRRARAVPPRRHPQDARSLRRHRPGGRVPRGGTRFRRGRPRRGPAQRRPGPLLRFAGRGADIRGVAAAPDHHLPAGGRRPHGAHPGERRRRLELPHPGAGAGPVAARGPAHRRPPGGGHGALPRGLAPLRRPLAQHPRPAPVRAAGGAAPGGLLGRGRGRGGGAGRADPGCPRRRRERPRPTWPPASTPICCCSGWGC